MIKKLLRSLVEGLGSKRLTAITAGALAVLCIPLLNKKFGLALEPAEFNTLVGSVLGPVFIYVLSQWHIDVSTSGQTTTAVYLLQKLAHEAALALPPQTIAAKIASAVDKATDDVPPPGPAAPPPATS